MKTDNGTLSAGLCSSLIRIDSTNTGEASTTVGERAIAEYVAAQLSQSGLAPALVEGSPGRTNVLARIDGMDASAPGLLVHAHLDVVPADPAEWTVHPHSGEMRDGYVWGRGAVDMKHFVAMVLTVVADWHAGGARPRRDIVLAFTADEENGGRHGAHYLTQEHRGYFDGCAEAIGEVGGFSYATAGQDRLYLIQVGEKGLAWTSMRAHGRAGHGSFMAVDNPVTTLAAAVARLGAHEFPVGLTTTTRAMLAVLREVVHAMPDEEPDAVLARLGPIATMLRASLRDVANPTRLIAGYKHNVIPAEAVAIVDGRVLPGHEETFFDEFRRIVGPGVEVQPIRRSTAIETPFETALVEAMGRALTRVDEAARLVPYLLPGGTDAKAFASLGMRCYGFTPLLLPPELDFSALFHGIDERVPISGLGFGVTVLDHFLLSA